MEIKTTMRYHFTHIRIATKKKKVLVCMWRNWNLCALPVGMLNGAASTEYSMAFSQQIKDMVTI